MERPAFIPAALWETLLANGHRTAGGEERDPAPVIKLFTPDARATWLLTEVEPCEPDRAFGLCDLGLGCPELGYVSLSELAGVTGPLGLHIERDEHFRSIEPLSVHAVRARAIGRIAG